jgi:nucleotide-binding universal stress UspA family protein
MTTHGRGPLSRFWLGSVADEFIRKTSVPVLLVRPKEGTLDLSQEPVVRRVLIPLDGSGLAEQILGPAVALGSLMNADYTLLRVVCPPLFTVYDPAAVAVSPVDQTSLEEERTQAQAYLDQVAQRLRARSLPVCTQVLVGMQPHQAILEEVQAQGVDLIALATHGRKGLTRLLLGSIADKLVRGAGVPVLVHRPSTS